MKSNFPGAQETPFHLSVLHGNYAGPRRVSTFVEEARSALASVTPEVVDQLLGVGEWRCRITAPGTVA